MSKERNICTVKWCRNEGSYCRLHLTYTVPVKTEINKVSEKKKDLDKQFAKAKKEYLREHPLCETKGKIEGCTKVAVDVHHKSGKSSEELLLDKSLFLATCRHCHVVIEKNVAFAKQNGFSVVSRLSKNKRAA